VPHPLRERAPVLDDQSLRVLVWDRDLVDMWCLDGAGGRRPYRGKGSLWHVHPEVELTVITHGSGLLYVGDHIGRFTAPDCLLLGADVPHVWKADGPTAGVSVQFRGDGALAALPEFSQLAPLWSRARYGLRWRGRSAERLRDELPRLEQRPSFERLARFLAIIDALRRAPKGDASRLSAGVIAAGERDRSGAAMHRVLSFIMDRYRERISLDTVVRMSGRSQATFCRHFSRLTGKTFRAYVNAIRIQEVRRALAESDRGVTDIALAAGFDSLTNFYAVFRAAVGCSPRAFRRALAG
jgi:AraC-like DNA-binding protein